MTPYLQFNRNQWAALRDSVPMTLTEEEIARLKGINEDLSLEEVAGSICRCHVCSISISVPTSVAVRCLSNFLAPTASVFLTSSVLQVALRLVKVLQRVFYRRCLAAGRNIVMLN